MHHVLLNRVRPVMLAAAVAIAACAQPRADSAESESSPSGRDAVDVLTIGGGTAHDFDRWFKNADSETLAEMDAAYTEAPEHVLLALDTLDVLRITNNQPLPGAELREGIFDFVGAGKGLVVGHAGAWYNWQDWPEYYTELVGGGTHGHRHYGEFQVDVVNPDHPVMAGVPSTFSLEDELYWFEKDPEGSPIEVLASAEDPETGDVYPIVWTVNHANGRIVVNTLGHDGAAHEHPAYARILKNSVSWAARRTE